MSQNLGLEMRANQFLQTHLKRSRERAGMHRRTGVRRSWLLAMVSAGGEMLGGLRQRLCIFFNLLQCVTERYKSNSNVLMPFRDYQCLNGRNAKISSLLNVLKW